MCVCVCSALYLVLCSFSLPCLNRYVERLLDRINNGKLSEDRRNAITELQAVVSENKAYQLAFGAMGTHPVSQTNCFSFLSLVL